MQFLEKVRQQLCKEFPELKQVSTESLMYVKEDLIIPHVSEAANTIPLHHLYSLALCFLVRSALYIL